MRLIRWESQNTGKKAELEFVSDWDTILSRQNVQVMQVKKNALSEGLKIKNE